MYVRLINRIACFTLLALLIQCKKDNDAAPPVVQISSPTDGQVFGVYDSFTILATVSDDKQLTSVSIKLLNEQQAVMQDVVTLTASGKQLSLNRQYTLYDVHLPTGYYYIRVEASDGVSIGSAYRKIYIHEAPTFRKAIYAITKASSALNLVKIDSALNAVNKLSFPGDFASSGISSYDQYLYVSGNYTGSVRAIDIQNNSFKWLVNPIINGNPYFTSLYCTYNRAYVSFYSGGVGAYDRTGASRYQTQLMSNGFYPIKVTEAGDYLLVEAKDKTSSAKKLATYLLSTGVGTQEIPFSKDVVDYLVKTTNEVFVFSNNAGQGTMELYDIMNNMFFAPHVMPVGKIWSAVRVDGDNYLVGYDDGNIYHYQYSQNSFTSFVSGIKPYKMRYDALNTQLIVAEANDVKLYNYSPSATTLANTVTLADSILDIQVLFNK